MGRREGTTFFSKWRYLGVHFGTSREKYGLVKVMHGNSYFRWRQLLIPECGWLKSLRQSRVTISCSSNYIS